MAHAHALARPASPVATYEDLWSVPDGFNGEIIAGELIVSPRPAPLHAYAEMGLGSALKPPYEKGRGGPGGWLLLPEPELHLSGDALIPDLAGWRMHRIPRFDRAAVTVAPDFVCEILSPRTAARDRGAKAAAYAREGVSHYWLVDPRRRTLEVWRLDTGRWVVVDLFHGDVQVMVEPFRVAPLDLSELWYGPAPTQEQLAEEEPEGEE